MRAELSAAERLVKRDELIRSLLIGAVVIALAFVMLLTDRTRLIGDREWMMRGAPLAVGSFPSELPRIIDNYGIHMRKRSAALPLPGVIAPPEPDWGKQNALRFGYSIIETSILGMPFVPRKAEGHVIYYETPKEFVYILATDDYMRQMKIAGGPLHSQIFPWWEHLWGWLLALALIGIGWFERGALQRRRDAAGLI